MNFVLRTAFTRCLISKARARHSWSKEETPWALYNRPGPYPKTEEERVAAAKKYGLLREEYEPYPDDGDGLGDYPKLKGESTFRKDPYHPWDYVYYRRLYGEPIPADGLMYIPVRTQVENSPFTMKECLWTIGLLLTILCGPLILFEEYRNHHRIMEKQYPTPGVTHYLFDLEDIEATKKH